MDAFFEVGAMEFSLLGAEILNELIDQSNAFSCELAQSFVHPGLDLGDLALLLKVIFL